MWLGHFLAEAKEDKMKRSMKLRAFTKMYFRLYKVTN